MPPFQGRGGVTTTGHEIVKIFLPKYQSKTKDERRFFLVSILSLYKLKRFSTHNASCRCLSILLPADCTTSKCEFFRINFFANVFNKLFPSGLNGLGRRCQTRELLGATLYVGYCTEGRVKFSVWRTSLFWATISVIYPEAKSISKKRGLVLPSIFTPSLLLPASISKTE